LIPNINATKNKPDQPGNPHIIADAMDRLRAAAPVTESKTHDTHLSLSELFQHKDHPVIHDMEKMAIILAINNIKLGSNMTIQ
tara:strand:+ start:270 stop:518 length:249 start_codon:yes stop_codon:yes gene_type:complete